MNQVVIVGRLTQDLTVEEFENGVKRTSANIAVNRGYKNVDGIYETDFIRCVFWNGIAETTATYCHKGDIVGVKGRLQTSSYEKDGETKYSVEIIAEKVTFLSNKKNADIKTVSTDD